MDEERIIEFYRPASMAFSETGSQATSDWTPSVGEEEEEPDAFELEHSAYDPQIVAISQEEGDDLIEKLIAEQSELWQSLADL